MSLACSAYIFRKLFVSEKRYTDWLKGGLWVLLSCVGCTDSIVQLGVGTIAVSESIERELDDAGSATVPVIGFLKKNSSACRDHDFLQRDDAELDSLLDNLVVYEHVNAFYAEVSRESLETLREEYSCYISSLSPNLRMQTLLHESGALIGATDAEKLGYDGDGVRVAIIDSGIDAVYNEYIRDRVVGSFCTSDDCFFPDQADLESLQKRYPKRWTSYPLFHGTHVAGIVGSEHPRERGIAPGADLIDYRTFDSQGGGTIDALLEALDMIVDSVQKDARSVQVINMSLGMYPCTEHQCAPLPNNCDQLPADHPLAEYAGLLLKEFADIFDRLSQLGVVSIAASGNDGLLNGMTAPACLSSVVSVGAIHEDRKADTIAEFSNLGNALRADGKGDIDLLAPGTNIKSTLYGYQGTTTFNGTSMASPHAAGVAALVVQANPNLSAEEVREVMHDTGKIIRHKPGFLQCGGRKCPRLEYRRVDALAAVKRAKAYLEDPAEFDISGRVVLEGLPDASGTRIFVSQRSCSQVVPPAGPKVVIPAVAHQTLEATGRFSYRGKRPKCIWAYKEKFLIAEYRNPRHGDLGTVILLGGDVTGNNRINHRDYEYARERHHTKDLSADIDGDGEVQITNLCPTRYGECEYLKDFRVDARWPFSGDASLNGPLSNASWSE